MSQEWNKLAGELRSSLAARDWHQAGAIVWQLRQLDGERFKLELEHYTNEQVRKGGYGMTLYTEQRLEAVRQWAYEGFEIVKSKGLSPAVWYRALESLCDGEVVISVFEHLKSSSGSLLSFEPVGQTIVDTATEEVLLETSCLARSGPTDGFTDVNQRAVRDDIRDVLWVVLQDVGQPSEEDYQRMLENMDPLYPSDVQY